MRFHIYAVSKIVKMIETDSNSCQGLGKEGNGELLFNGHKVSVMQYEEFL